MVCMLAEKLAAVCLDTTEPDIVDWLRSRKIEIVPVSFRDTMGLGCNVVALGNDRVLSVAQSQDLNARLRALGFTVYDPDMSQFLLAGGGVHCMASRCAATPCERGRARAWPVRGGQAGVTSSSRGTFERTSMPCSVMSRVSM